MPQRDTRIGRFTPRILFYGIELSNPADGFFGNSVALGGEDIDKLAAHMGHAGHLIGFVLSEQAVEAGIAVGVNPAFVPCEVADGMLSLSINGELIPRAGRR